MKTFKERVGLGFKELLNVASFAGVMLVSFGLTHSILINYTLYVVLNSIILGFVIGVARFRYLRKYYE